MAHVELAASCAPRHVHSAAQVDREQRTERLSPSLPFSGVSTPLPARHESEGSSGNFLRVTPPRPRRRSLATAHTAISTAGTRPHGGTRPGVESFDDTDGLAARVGVSL